MLPANIQANESLQKDFLQKVDAITVEQLGFMLDGLMVKTLNSSITRARGAEGTIWIADKPGEQLQAVFNNGPNSRHFQEHKLTQPVANGLIGMVFSSQQPFCENEIQRHPQHSSAIDEILGCRTTAMIAVPLTYGERVRGVVSCVQLDEESPEPFDMNALSEVQFASTLLGRLIEHRLFSSFFDLEDEC